MHGKGQSISPPLMLTSQSCRSLGRFVGGMLCRCVVGLSPIVRIIAIARQVRRHIVWPIGYVASPDILSGLQPTVLRWWQLCFGCMHRAADLDCIFRSPQCFGGVPLPFVPHPLLLPPLACRVAAAIQLMDLVRQCGRT